MYQNHSAKTRVINLKDWETDQGQTNCSQPQIHKNKTNSENFYSNQDIAKPIIAGTKSKRVEAKFMLIIFSLDLEDKNVTLR